MTTLEICFTDRFWPSVYELKPAETKQVIKAVCLLGRNPLNDSLRLKPVEGDPKRRKYTCRASADLRLFGFKQGNVLLLERAGHHDDIYRLAERVDLVINEGTSRVVVVDRVDNKLLPHRSPAASGPEVKGGPGPFDHWGDADLREAGLDAHLIAAVRACRTEDDLFGLEVDDHTKLMLIDLLAKTPEQWRTPTIDAEAELAERFRAIVERGAVAGISPLFAPDEVVKLAAAPIEDWMVFLHPDQRAAVERRYEGPARVRGSAGTGKTAVALHRAAALVRRFREEVPDGGARTVLFTTFIRSLPQVLQHLYRRLPSTRDDDAIEFTNVDRLAHRICARAGLAPTIDERKVEAAFAAAWRAVVTPGSPLAVAGLTRDYVRDEIAYVIKGRALEGLDDYLAVERTGRRTRFGEAMRRQVWALRQEWDRRMREEGVCDFSDVILRALEVVRSGAGPRYRAVVVDEAQDLTLAALWLLRVLVNGPDGADRPDGLFIVGDGAQKIYPGGFTLRQAGVEVRGRTTVLRVNYRNTREIIEAAMAVAGGETIDDLGDRYERAAEAASSQRPGLKPVFVCCRGLDDQARFIAERIGDVVSVGAIGYGDIAVAAATNRQVEELQRLLDGQGVPTMPLQDYDGRPIDRVKVGTHFRIKGLEFKLVFLPCLGEGEFPRRRPPGQSDEEHAEQRALAISRLFVAMTRARDALFLLGTGDPSPIVAAGLDHFEVLHS